MVIKMGCCFHAVLKYQSEWLSNQSGTFAEVPSDILDVEAVASIVRCPKVCDFGKKYSPVFQHHDIICRNVTEKYTIGLLHTAYTLEPVLIAGIWGKHL